MLGRDLRVIREACGVTRGDLAAALEWDLTVLSDRERGVSPLSDVAVAEVITVLARILRARPPVVLVDKVTRPASPSPTTGLVMLRVLSTGERTTSALAAAMRHPRFTVTTLARSYVLKGCIVSRGKVPSEIGGPPQHLYAITDVGRAYLKENER